MNNKKRGGGQINVIFYSTQKYLNIPSPPLPPPSLPPKPKSFCDFSKDALCNPNIPLLHVICVYFAYMKIMEAI